MKTLYLAKEPDAGVRDDLSRISGEITIVDCLNGYGDWYRKKGYNCIVRLSILNSMELCALKLLSAILHIKHQSNSKRGKGGNNSLYQVH